MSGNQGFLGWSQSIGAVPYVNIQDVKATNTAGGTFTSGAWRTRDLNTIQSDDAGICTLSNNQFTIPPGTYLIDARLPARAVAQHNARLQNITAGTTTLNGSTARTDAAQQSQTDSFVNGRFRIYVATTFEVQHQCSTTLATTGFGNPSNFTSTPEVYTVVELWKIG